MTEKHYGRIVDVPQQFIIEGVDRLGKSTVIEGLLQELGYYLVVHYEKPKHLKAYGEDKARAGELYMRQLYRGMFDLIEGRHRVIFDRGHLGEVVYGPIYRKYNADYVYSEEGITDTTNTRLILLTTTDWSFVEDDGLSLDFSKKEVEQAGFVEAFERSNIVDKLIIDVASPNGGRKTKEQVLSEVLRRK